MGESRTELLAWLNELSRLGVTKVEQCGSGAAHCVIIDSIYRDIPLHKVKFNAKHEYEYVANFKVLQAAFDKHHIENAIPVERLIKCKFQDNLEFLQWMKKFWDQYYPGGTYDALARRKGEAGAPASTRTAAKSAPASRFAKSGSVGSVNDTPVKPVKKAARQGAEGQKQEIMAEYQKMTNEMTQQIMELKVTVEQVEKEREFYFNKLREIEVLIQSQIENGVNGETETILKEVQSIMYKTEDGFELPDAPEAAEPVAIESM